MSTDGGTQPATRGLGDELESPILSIPQSSIDKCFIRYQWKYDLRSMPSRYEEEAYGLLAGGPVRASEMAQRLGVTPKTVMGALMHLALTREDVRYGNLGRIHIFWRET